MRQRTKLVLNVGNLLELTGAICAICGVYKLAGLAWALIATAVLLVAAAELIYDDHAWRIPLPRKPQPRRWVLEQQQRSQIWRTRQHEARRRRRSSVLERELHS